MLDLQSTDSCQNWQALVSFSEQIGKISTIKDLLFFLKNRLPKKFKTGEIFLFYESKQFGLRRAYVKNKTFYEESAQGVWPVVNEIEFSSLEMNQYLAQEMGRPFLEVLMVPFINLDKNVFYEVLSPVLFIELLKNTPKKEAQSFFREGNQVLSLILNRALLNTSVSRISYLWSQVFGGWGEPLAILKDTQVLRCNEPFKKLLKTYPNLLSCKKEKELLNIEGRAYQVHYYPISHLDHAVKLGLFYCEDKTRAIQLKEEFFHSQKMSALYELSKNIAHELNNPLTGVRSMAQILSKDQNLKDFAEDFDGIEQAVARSQKIITNLLTFSQLKKSEMSFCCLNQLVEDTLPLLKSSLSGICLKWNRHPQKMRVQGDLALLQQVFYNLMINASQALKECSDGRELQIQVTLENASDKRACLKVKDNGIGIQKDHLEKVFQSLWTTKKTGEGTGLGLSMTRQILHRFGGDIQVSSERNQWTCFTVSLPVKE